VIARVVPDVTGLDKEFDYLVPPDLVGSVETGDRVRVSLHGRRVGGWVVALSDRGELSADRLKPLLKLTGRGPDVATIALARWARVRWAARGLRPFLVAASSPRAVVAVPDRSRGTTAGTGALHPGVVQLRQAGGVIRVGPSESPDRLIASAGWGGPVLVVMPSVDEVAGTVERVRNSGSTVAVWPDQWAAAAAGVDVVVGTRTAIWARVPSLAALVVWDEHDEALQEERSPTWNARDVAIERARRAQIPVYLVSPIPTVAARSWAGADIAEPTIAESRAAWPVVDLVDRSREEPWKTSLVTPRLITALRDHSRTVVCVHNTKGRARVIACRACRSLQRCERCDAAVRLDDDRRLACARCGLTRPAVCQSCGGTGFANLRPGVTRLREELEAAAGRPVVRVTAEDSGEPPPAGVYIGTEAVLHRVPTADVVAYLDLDAELLAPRYRAGEQALALLSRGARLVGDRAGGGRLLVQTFLPRHEVLRAVLLADPARVATTDAERRRSLDLPPFSSLARISGTGAEEFAAAVAATPGVSVGPAHAETGWLVRAPDHDRLSEALLSTARPPGSRLRVEVDPPRV
jgi:primosomal protein N' (replication factor Y)